MDDKDLAVIVQRLLSMVSSMELATAAVVETLVEKGVIDRTVLLKGLIEKRDALDQKFSRSGFDVLIATLAQAISREKH